MLLWAIKPVVKYLHRSLEASQLRETYFSVSGSTHQYFY